MDTIVFPKQKLLLWDQSVQEMRQEPWKRRNYFLSLGPDWQAHCCPVGRLHSPSRVSVPRGREVQRRGLRTSKPIMKRDLLPFTLLLLFC